MTALKCLHPYPAMIADELASTLAAQYVSPDNFVVDPFCGTGRTLLAAAELGAHCLGVDVNPLAVLVLQAKTQRPDCIGLEKLLGRLQTEGAVADLAAGKNYDLEPDRKVAWFTASGRRELRTLITLINSEPLNVAELKIAAAVLSATVRDVSLCRNDQWKLHRVRSESRSRCSRRSSYGIFARRLAGVVAEIRRSPGLSGSVAAVRGDARSLSALMARVKGTEAADVVLTSPPYGDSRSTVGYGAVSGICLGVVRHITGFSDVYVQGGIIDRLCLGGAPMKIGPSIRRFWSGSDDRGSVMRVGSYLSDLEVCGNEIAKALKPGGFAVFVISRRRVGGVPLFLDKFLKEILTSKGMVLEHSFTRLLEGKRTPSSVDRRARSREGKAATLVATMSEEIIMAFRKRALRAR